jgi:hypothetical protein
MDTVALLVELQALANDAPDFGLYSPSSRVHLEWLGKTYALIRHWNSIEAISFAHSSDMLSVNATRHMSVAVVLGTLHRAIAAVKLQVPAHPNQVFGPGAVYDFYKALRDLLASATGAVLVLDPYLDEHIFDTYLSAISQTVAIRLLARTNSTALRPALDKFLAQSSRAVDIRRSSVLHDRVIFIDGRTCWVLGQSIGVAAKSQPTYLAPLTVDAVPLKLAFYETIWAEAVDLKAV